MQTKGSIEKQIASVQRLLYAAGVGITRTREELAETKIMAQAMKEEVGTMKESLQAMENGISDRSEIRTARIAYQQMSHNLRALREHRDQMDKDLNGAQKQYNKIKKKHRALKVALYNLEVTEFMGEVQSTRWSERKDIPLKLKGSRCGQVTFKNGLTRHIIFRKGRWLGTPPLKSEFPFEFDFTPYLPDELKQYAEEYMKRAA